MLKYVYIVSILIYIAIIFVYGKSVTSKKLILYTVFFDADYYSFTKIFISVVTVVQVVKICYQHQKE